MRILLLSSADPTVGPGMLVSDAKNRLENGGHEVVVYTKYPVAGHPEFRYILSPETKFQSIVRRAKDYWLNHVQKRTYMFYYTKETRPPVNSDLVVSRIEGEYDMVYIYFLHKLLSFQTIKKLHDKYPVPFVLCGVDNWPFTGGCHFVNDCKRYTTGCGKCPGIRSHRSKDFTYFNAHYRRAVVDEIKPVFTCNGATEEYYTNSFVTKGHLISKSIGACLDENFFKPKDKTELRKQFSIPDKYRRILMFGCQSLSDKRKGMDLLVKSLKIVFDRMPESDRKSIFVISAGKHNDALPNQILFDYREFGFVDMTTLSDLYSLADVYLSPSVIDPGPIMVNQALMCGTPVIAYNIGTALDVVKDRGTGYCATVPDYKDFADGISRFLEMSDEELHGISQRCREFSLETSSNKSKEGRVMKIYQMCIENK